MEKVWLSAKYYFPSVYSIRLPNSSPYFGMGIPAPGPSTVRLALIKTSLELLGEDVTRDQIFSVVRRAKLFISPPRKVAFTRQFLKGMKVAEVAQKKKSNAKFIEGFISREFAHADGELTIYLETPVELISTMSQILEAVPYWGQSNSLCTCTEITLDPPDIRVCGALQKDRNLLQIFGYTCSLYELSENARWDQVFFMEEKESLLIPINFVWPMKVKQVSPIGYVLSRLE